jgi:putative ABC transport system permease protein
MQASTLLPVTPSLGVVTGLLVVGSVGVVAIGRLGHGRATLRAPLRAAVQLGVASLVITKITRSPPLIAAFLLIMLLAAGRTAGRRITTNGTAWWALVPVCVAAMPVVAVLLATGVVPLRGIAVIPIAGILIGGALTAVSLSGHRALDELTQRRGEVEAAMALGFTDRDAALEICRPHAAATFLPLLDRTRTIGLVTLPGTFVGLMLAGATPLTAGAVQLLTMIAQQVVDSIAVVVTIELAARGVFTRPGEPTASRGIVPSRITRRWIRRV